MTTASGAKAPPTEEQDGQRAWDGIIAAKIEQECLAGASNDIDRARLLAASAPHFGDWLNALPNVTIGVGRDGS